MKERATSTITIQVHLLNSLRRYGEHNKTWNFEMTLPEGSTSRDVLEALRIPPGEVYLLMVNGKRPGRQMCNLGVVLKDCDRLVLSGPIPFSRVYGTPVI